MVGTGKTFLDAARCLHGGFRQYVAGKSASASTAPGHPNVQRRTGHASQKRAQDHRDKKG
jgi:hypothetical protein